MHAAQKPKSKIKFVTLDKKSIMSTLWRREELLRICSKEDNTIQEKSRGTVQPRITVFLRESFLGQATR